jgi:CHAT domain-containing protein
MELQRQKIACYLIAFAIPFVFLSVGQGAEIKSELRVVATAKQIETDKFGLTKDEKSHMITNDTSYLAWVEGRINKKTISLLAKMVSNRVEYGYASPLEVFDILMSSPPTRPGDVADGWIQFMILVNSQSIEDADLAEKIRNRFVLMDEVLRKLAESGSEERHVRLLVNLANFRAIAGWDSALPLLDKAREKIPIGTVENITAMMTEAYLHLNLIFDAQKTSKSMEASSPEDEDFLRASYAKSIMEFQIKCFSKLSIKNSKNEIDTALMYLLATNGLNDGYISYNSARDESERSVLDSNCISLDAGDNFRRWPEIFNKVVPKNQGAQKANIAYDVPRQQLHRIDLSYAVTSQLRNILEGEGTLSNKKEKISRLVNRPSIFNLLSKSYVDHEVNKEIEYHSMIMSDSDKEFGVDVEPPPKLHAKKLNVIFFGEIDHSWIVRLVGQGEPFEFLVVVNKNNEASLLVITATEINYEFSDVTGDGRLDVIIKTYQTMDARYLQLYIIDLFEEVGYNLGKNYELYHGVARVSNVDGLVVPSVIIGSMQENRTIDDCNTCPGRYIYSEYRYDSDSRSLILIGRYQSIAQMRDLQSEGVMGLSSGGILSSTISSIESQIRQFETANFKLDQRLKSESLVRENLETALYYVKAGNVSDGDNLAKRVFSKLSSMKEVPWASDLLAIAHWVWADGLRSAGESERAKIEIENPDILKAVSSGKIPKIDIMILDALISYDLGDLSRAYINNDLIVNAPDEKLDGLNDYAQFLASIGYIEQAIALNNRIANKFSDPASLLLKAKLSKGDTLSNIRLLTIAISKARLWGDHAAAASVLLESGKLSYANENYQLAESFFIAAMFESTNAWWQKNGSELLVDLGRTTVAQKKFELAKKMFESAARLGNSYSYRARSDALYELSKLNGGDERYSYLISAYESATRFRLKIPTEERKLDYVKSTDAIVDDLLKSALERSVSADEILGIVERWRFQVFNELYIPASIAQSSESTAELGKRIRSGIASSDALVVYYIGEAIGFAVVANTDSIQISKIQLNSDAAKALTKKTLKYFDLGSVSVRHAIENDRIPLKLKDALSEGFEKLIAPLNLNANIKRIIVVPDKSLNGIPWTALDISGHYFYSSFLESLGFVKISPLVSSFEINVLPSAMVMSKDKGGATLSAALIASGWGVDAGNLPQWLSSSDRQALGNSSLHPLKGTLEEVNNAEDALKPVAPQISKLLFTPSLQNTAETDDMTLISDAINGRSVVLVAAHGIYNSNLPMLSFLLIDGSKRGLVLRAVDFLKFDLSKAKLVMLTACQSANVEIKAGNEVMGFTRALFASGAQALVLTGWLVDDQASIFYTSSFFDGVTRGLSMRNAHSEAIASLRSRYAHPFYWASYMFFSRD